MKNKKNKLLWTKPSDLVSRVDKIMSKMLVRENNWEITLYQQTPTYKFGVSYTCFSDKPVNQKLLSPYSTNLGPIAKHNILVFSVKNFFHQNMSEGEFFFAITTINPLIVSSV